MDGKDFFKVQFAPLWRKMLDREYNSVSAFSRDILSILSAALSSRTKIQIPDFKPKEPLAVADSTAVTHSANHSPPLTISIPAKPPGKAPGDNSSKTAGRILRAIQPMLEDARQ